MMRKICSCGALFSVREVCERAGWLRSGMGLSLWLAARFAELARLRAKVEQVPQPVCCDFCQRECFDHRSRYGKRACVLCLGSWLDQDRETLDAITAACVERGFDFDGDLDEASFIHSLPSVQHDQPAPPAPRSEAIGSPEAMAAPECSEYGALWAVEKPKKHRANYLPAPHYYALNHATRLINDAFGGFGCYLVGSCLQRQDYRDVDVRLILEDAAYDRWFGKPCGEHHEAGGVHDPLWTLMCLSISEWLRSQTMLPVDFQIQRHTQANEKHSGCKRSALGLFLDYPGERPSDIEAPK